MAKIDDDDLNFLNEIDEEKPKEQKKPDSVDASKEKLIKQFSDLTGLLIYSPNGTPVVKPKPIDAAQAKKITKDNKAAQLSRELMNTEDKIKDACLDGDSEITYHNLFPETVEELKARGFKVTAIPATFLDDPVMWHRSESASTSVRYVISWKAEDILN